MFSLFVRGIFSFTVLIDATEYVGETMDSIVSANNLNSSTIFSLNITDGQFSFDGFTISNFKRLSHMEIAQNSFTGKITESAFVGLSEFKSFIANGVTEIGDLAFANLTTLDTVSIASAKIIGKDSFYGCSKISSIDLPNCVSIGDNAFSQSSIKAINAPTLSSIGEEAFSGTKLVEINFPKLNRTAYGAFQDCNELIKAILPNVEEISSYTFSGCDILGHVECDKCKKIDVEAFRYNLKLETISLPLVTYIGNAVFAHSNIAKMNLPNLEVLDFDVFSNCMNLVEFTAPKLKTMAGSVFYNCRSLKTVDISNLKELEFDKHFYNCTSLPSINLTSLQTVNDQAAHIFDLCINLTTIYFPSMPPKTFSKSIQFTNINIVLPSKDDWKNYISECNITKGKYFWHGFDTGLLAPKKTFIYIIIVVVSLIVIAVVCVFIYFFFFRSKKLEANTTEATLL